jgi:hypothetical protein
MEILLKHFSLKFSILRNIFDKINALSISIDDILSKLNDIEMRFALTTSPLQLQLLCDDTNRNEIISDFDIIINTENFLSDINNIFIQCIHVLYKNGIYVRVRCEHFKIKEKKKKALYNNIPPSLLEIQNLIDIYPMDIEYTQDHQYINYRICNVCNYEMEVDSIKSELICNNCAMIKPLIGISFENIQFCNYDSQKSKSGTFNPNRHFHTWWSHILAKEDESEITNNDANNNLFEKLHFIIKRDKKVLRFLTVIDIRNMLREIKKSELNKNISLILKKITGIGPPSISEEVEIRVENLFNKVIEMCENIKRGSRTNRNYYPYYIYKIIDSIIPEEDFDIRRILYYIYIQSKETVEDDDLDWEQICKMIPELTYKPTDRMQYLKYMPE